MTTLTATRPVAATSRPTGLGTRFVTWLLALDAGYRNANTLAHMTDARLADMGVTREQAQAEFARHSGTVDAPATTGW
ncbi:MAG: hypothetical protein MUF63_00345 [Rhodobacteraceae bacterium]|jgi:uncharacterized protein YjiS (DUF1127 family)|nr:hypothetical protein [Paracoccaceae bacterium]